MPDIETAQPAKRGPGRPRKSAAAKVESSTNVEPVEDAWKTPVPTKLPPDERVGQQVADDRWTSIGFDDGRSYRIENGVIVERIG